MSKVICKSVLKPSVFFVVFGCVVVATPYRAYTRNLLKVYTTLPVIGRPSFGHMLRLQQRQGLQAHRCGRHVVTTCCYPPTHVLRTFCSNSNVLECGAGTHCLQTYPSHFNLWEEPGHTDRIPGWVKLGCTTHPQQRVGQPCFLVSSHFFMLRYWECAIFHTLTVKFLCQ
jgi:hypothetical protein